MTHGTWRATGNDALPARVILIDSHDEFAVGDLCVAPFPVPHDAREPVQFVFTDGDSRLGVLTDIGMPTPHVGEVLSACDALVLECNHDREMLAGGRYPGWLKQRIGGPFGHLANDAAADLLAMIDTRRLRHVVAAHLSESNNTPALARAALAGALGCAADWIGVASQESGFDWREL
jgi:phosphoribosyl 1,2-cyclic phosphodiesterase